MHSKNHRENINLELIHFCWAKVKAAIKKKGPEKDAVLHCVMQCYGRNFDFWQIQQT